MKNLVLAVVASVVSTEAAVAADLPARLPVKAPVVAALNWTGCYLGAGGGYAMWNQDATGYNEGPPRQQVTDTTTGGGRGTFATLQAGCDYQFALGSARLVAGAFGDYDFPDVTGRYNSPIYLGGGNTGVGGERMNSMWAVGGRLGVLVSPDLLTYVSGGYTEAGFGRIDLDNIILGGRFNGPQSYIPSQTYRGYFIGTGDEFALSFLPGLTWKNEYRLSVFDTATVPVRDINTGQNFGAILDTRKWVHSVRAGLTYRFNDKSVRATAAAAPAPQMNWTGCYVGAGGGYGMWNQESTGQFVPADTFTDTVTHGGRGYFATGQLGCDVQLSAGRSKFVLGVFGDYDHANLSGKVNPPWNDFTVREEKMSAAWAFGGRLGWEARSGLLAYLSGGLTEATFDGSRLYGLNGPPFLPQLFAVEKQVYKGWFVGGGDEYALDIVPGLFWKNEYRFSRYNGEFNRPRFLVTGNLAAIGDYSEKWTHTVRSELVYRFNWGGMAAAK